MALTFPTSPTNGQTATINGTTYTYTSVKNAWAPSAAGVDLSSVSQDILADADSSRSLGSSTNKWKNLHASNITSGDHLPLTDSSYNLGSLTKKWKSLYLSSNTLFLGDSGSISAGAGGAISMPLLKIGSGEGAVELTASADGKLETKGTTAAGVTESAAKASGAAKTVTDMPALVALSGMATGETTLVTSLNRIFMYTGTGWFKIADMTNESPTAITGVAATTSLATDGTATTVTAVSTDPEGFPLTWSYAVTTGSLGSTATVSQADNVFTITPSSTEADAGSFSITFSVTDGATGAVSATSAFTLAFWSGDIANASYDSVSFSVASQDTSPYGIAFNPTGTKMYMMGYGGDIVYQYSLSTGFDLSTASYDSVIFSVGSQDTAPYDIHFNPTGTKMYLVGATNKSVYQYSLSTGFDLSTASYDSVSFSVASQDAGPTSIWFNSTGTKMYMVGYPTDTVYQYSLSTGFDLSTASYDSVSFSIASQDSEPMGIWFNPTGTKMYMVGYTNDSVYQYSLSTGFDLSTASYDSVSFSVSGQDTNPYGFAFNPTGTKMYIMGWTNKSVYQYSV